MKLSQKIALNSSAQIVRQILLALFGVVSVGLSTRYLTVDQYGSVLAALVLVTLLSVATDFGVSAMTVRAMARDPEHEDSIQSSAFWVWVAFTIPTALTIYLVSLVSYPGAGGETTRNSVLVLMTIFPLVPFAGVANVRATADQRVWIISIGTIVARAIALAAIVVISGTGLGPIGIAAAFASGYVLEQIINLILVRPHIGFRDGLHRGRIGSLVVAAIPLGTVMVINGLYFRLDAFLLSLLGTERDIAIYGVAYKGFESLLALPGFVMVTLIPVLSQLDFKSPRFNDLVQKAFSSMTILALPIIGFSVFGSELMVALGGHQYDEGGVVLALIMVAVSFACLQGVFGNALVTQGRQGTLLKVSVAVLIANGLLNFVAIPLFGDTGAAGVLTLTEALSLLFTLWVYRREAPMPRPYKPLRTLLALAALVAACLACTTIDTDLISLAVGVPTGLGAYVLVLVALGAVPPFVENFAVSTWRGADSGEVFVTAPRVSVCIPAYECGEALAQTLDSVWSQDFEDFEVVVVDDGSADDTSSVLAAQTDRRLRGYRRQLNLGQSATVGETVARARGELVKFLDSDDLLHPDCLSRMVATFDAHPSVALTFCRRDILAILPDDPRTTSWIARYGDLHTHFGDLGTVNGGADLLDRYIAGRLNGNWFAEPAGVMVRRRDLLAVGGYNPKVRQNNDMDLWARLMTRGEIAFIDATLFTYRLDFSGITGDFGMGYRQWLDSLWTAEGLLALDSVPDRRLLRQMRRRLELSAVRRFLTLSARDPSGTGGRAGDLLAYFRYRAARRAGRRRSPAAAIPDLSTTP